MLSEFILILVMEINRRFRGDYCLHHQSDHPTTRRTITEDIQPTSHLNSFAQGFLSTSTLLLVPAVCSPSFGYCFESRATETLPFSSKRTFFSAS
jgi:hypothetical protein